MAGVSVKLRSWWQEKTAAKPALQRRVSEDVLHLFRLRREHRLLRVRCQGVEEVFQSLLLEVDIQQDRLILDEPFPHRLPAQSWVGRKVKVASDEGSMATRFESNVVELTELDQVPALILAMPLEIMAAQRRHSFRVALEPHSPVDAVVRLPGVGNLAATVVDLSAQGIRLVIPGLFNSIDANARLCLRLGSEAPMVCELDVRNMAAAAMDDDKTVVGATMVGLNLVQVKTVERFLLRLQRVKRQRELELA